MLRLYTCIIKSIWIPEVTEMKKFVCSLLAMLLILSAMGACAETLVMGTNIAFPPYEFYDDETGEPAGIDVEIAQAIAAKLGYDLEIQDMEFDSLIPAVVEGKINFSMAGMTVTDERLQSVDFSTSYATGVQVIIVPEGSAITSLDDLTADGVNWSIGVQNATTGDLYSTWDFEDAGLATVQRFKTGADAVLALTSGKVDFVMIDSEPAKNFVAANDGLVILDSAYALENYAAAIAKDDPFLDEFNTALAELTEDGTVPAIIEKYIPAE